ncbi:hypothetical protein A2Z23_02640 [Candidatus Curtissbacteria bacterium RBG_16_39_7]|uniref:Uncharacterized protein n=1 Tax=Candidatus Curtissbacteria bacterium RBG_16_39_7 TaxID=1797707 RepID=A0A1F5G1R7_9BACT|nr:MAG: hypothetical protein A2Z23_02640 [Candidatus Curtissbacteria bacterium RBG_16_39_7]
MREIDRLEVREKVLEDEARKDREKFEYASDVIAQHCIVPFSIWVEPNFNMRKVLDGVDYGELPYDEDNEVQKGMFWKEQAEFIAKHEGQTMLCEALEEEPCSQTECPLFVPAGTTNPKHSQHLCREYKIAFATKKKGEE